MGEYSVGVATRNKIYEVARRLFYDKGIKATSYKDICEAAEVNRGLIPYYFKTKDALAALVLKDYFESLERAVDAHWSGLDQAVRNVLIEIFQFKLLESNENVLRFYGEVFSDGAFHAATVEEECEVIRQMCEGTGAKLSPAATETVARMLNGTESELVLALKEGAMREPLEDYVRRDLLTCYFLLDVPSERASVWIDKGFEMARGLTMTCDGEFACSVVPKKG